MGLQTCYTFEKKLDYVRFDNESQSFMPASDAERQSIQKSFMKRKAIKVPVENLLIPSFSKQII